MKKWILLLILPGLMMACKGKKKHLADSDVVDIKDFLSFFEESRLPLTVGDSTLQSESSDSAAISYPVFTRFIPDSLIARNFGKKHPPSIFPMGKVSVKKGETYLFVKAVSENRQAAYILAFDPSQKFVTGMPLLLAAEGNPTHTTATLDSRYTLTILAQHKKPDGSPVYHKEAFVFNDAGVFTLILTESNDVAAVKNVLINPIDTLPRKNKWAGDYMRDKMNLVSVRDGRSSSQLLVFIHFEQDQGSCRGELKGYARITGANRAVYHEQGDPCTLELTFSPGQVSLHEDGCGAHRDIKCFFEGSFSKKASAPAKGRKKSAKTIRPAT